MEMRISTLLLCMMVACGGDATNGGELLATGSWGGPDVGIVATARGATIQFVCAHGVIGDRIVPDANGDFSATGTYDFEHTVIVAGQPASDSHAARYDGQISGSTMRLSTTLLDTKQVFGPFPATLGTAGPSSRCQ
jgi:hypothetical protein